MGIEYVHQAMAHPLILAFLNRVETEEIYPLRAPGAGHGDPGLLPADRAALLQPQVADTERRLCPDGSNRQPKFIVPSIRDALAAGGSVAGSGAGLGALVPLLRRGGGRWHAHPAERSELGPAATAGPCGARNSVGLA